MKFLQSLCWLSALSMASACHENGAAITVPMPAGGMPGSSATGILPVLDAMAAPTGGKGGMDASTAAQIGGAGGEGGHAGSAGMAGQSGSQDVVCAAPCIWDLVAGCAPQADEPCIEQQAGNEIRKCFESGIRWVRKGDKIVTVKDRVFIFATDSKGDLCMFIDDSLRSTVYENGKGVKVATVKSGDSPFGPMPVVCADGATYMQKPTSLCVSNFHKTPCTAGVCP